MLNDADEMPLRFKFTEKKLIKNQALDYLLAIAITRWRYETFNKIIRKMKISFFSNDRCIVLAKNQLASAGSFQV